MNLEITLGLIACCLPKLPGLVKNVSLSQTISSLRLRLNFGSLTSLLSSNTTKGDEEHQ